MKLKRLGSLKEIGETKFLLVSKLNLISLIIKASDGFNHLDMSNEIIDGV